MIGIHRYASIGDAGERQELDYYPQSANIITIPAKTALPIVSSVPKCRNPKAPRSHPVDTVHGSHVREQAGGFILDQQHNWVQLGSKSSNSQGKQAALGRGKLSDNQVLLIVQDDHIKGGGIPVVGRRLANKSVALDEQYTKQCEMPQAVLLLDRKPEATYAQPTTVIVEQRHHSQQAPVLGRRTHRMLQQQQQEAKIYRQYKESTAAIGMKKHSKVRYCAVEPVSLYEAQLAPSNQQVYYLDERHMQQVERTKTTAKRPRAIKYNHNGSVANIADLAPLIQYALPPMVNLSGQECLASYLTTETGGNQLLQGPVSSTSCSSLCSSNPSTSADCSHCYTLNSTSSFGYLTQSTKELDSNGRRCCPPINKSKKHQAQPACPCCQPEGANQGKDNTAHRRVTSGIGAYNVKSSQTNATRASKHSSEVPYQSEHLVRSCSSNRHLVSRSGSPARNRKEPPANSEMENQTSAVSQMYESLAAELKAKLGNPNIGPILLPPKDYDTMSRKQGKLIGIEQRRSTNPQLVGPASINRQTAILSRLGKQPDDNHHLPRSRSNSSSGIGSISGVCGEGGSQSSPTNSKASSSENMSEGNIEIHDESRLTEGDRKNCSPDYCSSSGDSGHSGSARLDSRMSNTDEKIGTSTNPTSGEQLTGNARGRGIHLHNPSKVSDGVLWNGRVEVPLKVNSHKSDGNTYLATKQIIY